MRAVHAESSQEGPWFSEAVVTGCCDLQSMGMGTKLQSSKD